MFFISIITAAYNCSDTILETYNSIKKQTFFDWEWIVVEDHSTDDTFAVLKNLSSNDNRIILLQTPTNSGAAKARNLGISKASGRFIAFLDSDDMWKHDKLEKQLKFMLENNYAITYSNYDVLSPDGTVKPFIPKSNSTNYKQLLKKCDIGCLTVMYDTEKLSKVFMPIDTPKREDYTTWLDITRNGVVAYKLDENLAIYRLSSTSVSHNKFKMLKYHYNVYRKHERFNVFKSLYYLIIHSINKIFFKY